MAAKKWEDAYGNKLTMNEMEFVRLYCFGPKGVRNNATESYIQSYSMEKKKVKRECIAVYACELMAKDRIKTAVKKSLAIYNEEWVKQGLVQEAEEKENKAADRIRARELVGKTMGMFIEKIEQDVKIDGILINNDEKL